MQPSMTTMACFRSSRQLIPWLADAIPVTQSELWLSHEEKPDEISSLPEGRWEVKKMGIQRKLYIFYSRKGYFSQVMISQTSSMASEAFISCQWVVLIVSGVETCVLNKWGVCSEMGDLFLVVLCAASDFIEYMFPPFSTWTCCNQKK